MEYKYRRSYCDLYCLRKVDMEMRKMIKLLIVSFVCSIQHTTFAAVSSSDRNLILRLHNDFRSKVSPTASNMQKMYWDKKIAVIAQRYANSCPRGHDTSEDRSVEGYNVYIGQNLAWGYANWKAALSAWHGEVTMYRYGVDPETYLGPGGWGKIGHYTQVVRDKAVRVGCGVSECGGSSRTYVCNYALGNSYDLGRPYESGPSCSKCRGHCSNNLCDCGGKLCYNGGTLNLETCTCTCDELHKGDRCQKMNCPASDAAHCGRAAPYGFPPSYCDRYTNVPVECPIMCGLCESSGGSTDGSNSNGGGGGTGGGQPTESADCPVVDPWPCAEQWFPADCERYYNVPEACKIMCGTCPVKCPGKDFNYCKNGGTLDPNTCTCRCDSTWVGQSCEKYAVCPKTQDDSHCTYWPASHCDKYYNVPEECPYMCGLCGKK